MRRGTVMADVFISYARDDSARAQLLKERLEALGLAVFFDVDGGIDAGDSFPERIASAVIGSKAVLACWTPHALTRPWVRRECFMARELNKLVPVALDRLTAIDLKGFIDASYEDLADLGDKDRHFGWSRTLAALAQKIDAWAEANPDDPDASATIDRGATVRRAAHEARQGLTLAAQTAGAGHGSEAARLWQDIQGAVEPDRLIRFAESFPNTAEAYHARERAAELRREIEAEAVLDKSSSSAVKAFIERWPSHHSAPALRALLPSLEAAAAQRQLEEAAGRAEQRANSISEDQEEWARQGRLALTGTGLLFFFFVMVPALIWFTTR